MDDLADYGVLRVPGPEHGVAAGDPAGEVPVASSLEGFDYWEAHPARGAIVRVHVEWRRNLYNPANLPEGVTQDALQKVRVTQKELRTGQRMSRRMSGARHRDDPTPMSRGRRRGPGEVRRGSFSKVSSHSLDLLDGALLGRSRHCS